MLDLERTNAHTTTSRTWFFTAMGYLVSFIGKEITFASVAGLCKIFLKQRSLFTGMSPCHWIISIGKVRGCS
ncbi:hypothetical protein MRB53_020692 [Persea americana]|uniref:Uncharacterized protein n=1 Tax=Persea americana TaxID=3435 RepID=A0ACC2L239_PERAE|nr:hypothetical protein MRB53_020692 [Persea americana]